MVVRHLACTAVLLLVGVGSTFAQDDRRVFVGTLVGVSTLSADGRAVTKLRDAMLSLYKPENGLAINALVGLHVAHYFSLQANYIWNRNDLTLVSSLAAPQGGGFYEQRRKSAQHAVVADGLVYFRKLDSKVRPYLGTGLTVVRFTGKEVTSASNGLAPPGGEIVSTRIALRSHVGIDLALSRKISLRYSFSETISGNPISPHLSPPGERGLANFQNLVGLVGRL